MTAAGIRITSGVAWKSRAELDMSLAAFSCARMGTYTDERWTTITQRPDNDKHRQRQGEGELPIAHNERCHCGETLKTTSVRARE